MQYVYGGCFVSLKDVAEYESGRVSASEATLDNYVSVENLLPNKRGKTVPSSIPSDGTLTKFYGDDVLLGNIRPYLKKIWLSENEGCTNEDVLAIKASDPNILIGTFLFYALGSDAFFEYDTSHSKGAKMPRGDKTAIMDYRFYLPDISRQKEVVNQLKHFEKLCFGLAEGLPAEIDMRQKQYEYYRNQLLSFVYADKNV